MKEEHLCTYFQGVVIEFDSEVSYAYTVHLNKIFLNVFIFP